MLKKSGNRENRKKNTTLSARRLLMVYLPQLQTVALRKHHTLRQSCDEYIKKLKSEKRHKLSADYYFEPFRIACQTKYPDTVHVALNGIQNLVAGGYLTGDRMVKMSDAQQAPLIDIIVKTICECCDIPQFSTQLMVINTLLNLCTCGTTEVHGESLTLVIMSLYYIFLNSRDWDVQTSATATLTQTMTILFARVESVSTELTTLQYEMKRIEAKRALEREEKMKQAAKIEADSKTDQDDGYIIIESKQNEESKESQSGDYNAEELIEQIPLTTEDCCCSILQNIINNVTAAQEEKEKIKNKKQHTLMIVGNVIEDMITNSLQIHVERLADAYKRRGNQEYSKNRHRTALKYYQKAHQLNPKTPIYLVNMGITYYVLNELNESHRLCIDAVKVGKKNGAQIQWIAKAFSTLAHVAYKQQKISACIRFYRLSLKEYKDAKIKRKLNEIIQEFGDATTDKNDQEFWERVVTHSDYNTPEHTPSVPSTGTQSDNDDTPHMAKRKTQSQLVALLSKLYKDCFMVLEELCKLAAKQKVDKSLLQNNQWSSFLFPKNDNDLINIRSRSLSLRLLNSAMHNVGQHLSSTKKFISMIRTNLVPTLCANVTSTIESIIQMAMSIFKALVERFKHKLVSEIGVLFDSFLLLASSPNSTFQQKLEVLKVLSDICNDGHTTVSLFLNYDCSNQVTSTRPKVFQHIISTVEHINNTKLESRDWINEEEANALRTAALKCFVTIMESLVTWQCFREPQQENIHNSKALQHKSNTPLKPLVFNKNGKTITKDNKDAETKDNTSDELIRSGSMSSLNGTPPNEESVSLSTSEMEFPPNYHDIFVSQKKKEETFRNGVVKFNIKPTHGLKYLVQYGLLENKPESVVEFLRHTPSLDKTAVGEYIGGDKKFQIEVMHLYIDSCSFARMSFVDALRYLCASFMLPGEAQKIDRIIERFAARYCQENTNEFSSGDVAYILAYSVIILHSNIYNDNVKKKMTRSEFIKTCKSATDQVSDPKLSEIYDNICWKEMKLKKTAHYFKNDSNASDVSPSKKMMKLHKESREMIRDIKKKIRDEVKLQNQNAGLNARKYVDPNDADGNDKICKLIFSASCYAVLATFSVVIETSSSRTHISECYRGYRACIKLAAHLSMETECEAFVNSLYRFTLLGTLKPIRMKNIEAMKLLLELGNNEGNLLRSSWKAVIKCCSEIDILHLMATQAPADGAFWLDLRDRKSILTNTTDNEQKEQDNYMASVTKTGTANHESRKLGARTKVGSDGILRFQSNPNAQLISAHIDQNMVAKVFTGTEKLGPQAILQFVTYLCSASSDEIYNHANPRSFCLQKIVDIAHFNMHRVRFEWIQLWSILSAHFEKSGCHRNQQICIYAIDNLKQLADKFLQREELTTFNFQKDFLKPFLTIVERSQLPDIREYIIQCIARLIRARYKNIKSGWKCVFGILGVAARIGNNEHLVGTTFDIMIEILDLYFPMINKMSTRPSNNNQNIFKIPEESTIDMSSFDNNDHVVEHKIDETEEEEDSKSKPASHEQAKRIVYENEEQKQEHISKIQLLRIDAISDCVDTLLAFVANKFTDLSISAVDHISKVAQYLFESDQYLSIMSSGNNMEHSALMISIDKVNYSSVFQFTSCMNGGKPDLSRPLVKAWFLCLLGLSRGVNDKRLEVRTHCLQVLFRLLRAQGDLFDAIMWQRVYDRLLFPIFAELRQASSSPATPAGDKNHSHNQLVSFDSMDAHQREKKNKFKFVEQEVDAVSRRRKRSESVDNLAAFADLDAGAVSDGVLGRGGANNRSQLQRRNAYGKPVYDDYSWLETTCHPALSNLVELFHQFFFICAPILHDVVSLLCTFIIMKQSYDASQIGHQCLKRLLQALGPKLDCKQWNIVIADLIVSLKRTVPSSLKSERLRRFFDLDQNASNKNQQNGHEISIPNSILNIEKVSVLCTSQLSLINTLNKITKQHLNKLTLYQCVDILNAFQMSQDFVLSITKDVAFINKLKFLKYSTNRASPGKQDTNLCNLLYKLESTAFHCGLTVLFQCKNASIKHMHLRQQQQKKEIPKDDEDEIAIIPSIDENVQSQIVLNLNIASNTPPPPNSNNNMGLTINATELKTQKSMPEPVGNKNKNKSKYKIIIDNHKMSVNDIRQLSEYRLIPLGIQLMQLIYVRERKQSRSLSDTKYLVNAVSLFLKHLLSSDHFTDQEFNNKIRIIFPYLSRLIQCNSLQIRSLISKILLLRVSKCIVNLDNNKPQNGNYLTSTPSITSLSKNNSV